MHIRRHKFDEKACQSHVQCTKELVLDFKIHWNSTYLILSTALIYKDVFLVWLNVKHLILVCHLIMIGVVL